jgi:glycosyltransferase involved in cell wall biosynthesis
MLSLVIPVYKNEENIDRLLDELVKLGTRLDMELEVVFVVDGSPDHCYEMLAARLPRTPLRSQLIALSRNFGSFAAISAGLSCGRGDYFAVLAADLQEPPELAAEFVKIFASGEAEIVFGVRDSRSDPWLSELTSNLFWRIYRRFVVRDMPSGGVDVFGCTRAVRDQLLALPEVTTNLIALLFWIGFPRRFLRYTRQPRLAGKSAWSFSKKLQYCIDSIFNFTDLPIRLLLTVGATGSILAFCLGIVVLTAKIMGGIPIPGYTPIVLSISFFSGLITLGLGLIGQYLWLALKNTRNRPNFIIHTAQEFDRAGAQLAAGERAAGTKVKTA